MTQSIYAALVTATLLLQSPLALGGSEDEAENAIEIVVTANRVETPANQVGSSTTVVNRKEIEQQGASSISQLLRTVPSLDVIQSGGPGGRATFFIRGTDSEHTLVLIDGVEVNDPSGPNRSFNLADITLDNVERIEVLRGAQSTLYGSDAIGGVIQIFTRQGKDKNQVNASVGYGSQSTYDLKVGTQGNQGPLRYSLAVSRFFTEGISAASESRGNTERDRQALASASLRLGVKPVRWVQLDITGRFASSQTMIDDGAGAGGDDPNKEAKAQQIFFSAKASSDALSDWWEPTLSFNFTHHLRNTTDDPDAIDTTDFERFRFLGKILKGNLQNLFQWDSDYSLILGVESEKEFSDSASIVDFGSGPTASYSPNQTASTQSVYFQGQGNLWNRLFGTAGLRVDHHSRFGSAVTYRLASSYLLYPQTRLKGSVGTGFKAPTLFQLFDGFSGNAALLPEKVQSFDVGVEQKLIENKLSLEATYFTNFIFNLINVDSTSFRFINSGNVKTSGLEFGSTYSFTENFKASLNYTLTKTEDRSTGLDLIRRPKDKITLNLRYQFVEVAHVNLNIRYVGKRFDAFFAPGAFTSTRVEMSPYTLVGISGAYRFSPTFELFGRVENLFNKTYEDIVGFGAVGISVFGGVRVSI